LTTPALLQTAARSTRPGGMQPPQALHGAIVDLTQLSSPATGFASFQESFDA
jgi:hypothetical protein